MRQFRVGLGDFKERRRSRRIVERAIVDLIALRIAIDADMIPMRCVDDALVRRFAPDNPGDDIARSEASRRAVEFETRGRAEIASRARRLSGGLGERIVILSGFREERFRRRLADLRR